MREGGREGRREGGCNGGVCLLQYEGLREGGRVCVMVECAYLSA